MDTTTRPNGTAPAGDKYKIGAKGGKVGQAWQHIWDQLSTTDYKDGVALAEQAAEQVGIKPVSIISHLHRMAHEGHLETEVRAVDTTVAKFGKTYSGKRRRTHYRIAPAKCSDCGAVPGANVNAGCEACIGHTIGNQE